jgi:hypothetical protein
MIMRRFRYTGIALVVVAVVSLVIGAYLLISKR